jgi:hypothetical protein
MSVFSNPGDYIGEQILALPLAGTEIALTIPSGAKFARIFYNQSGTTGSNTVALYYGTDNANLIKFTDSGGMIAVPGPLGLSQFRAKSISGANETLQVFFHNAPIV